MPLTVIPILLLFHYLNLLFLEFIYQNLSFYRVANKDLPIVNLNLRFKIIFFKPALIIYEDFEFALAFKKFPHSAVIYSLDMFQTVFFKVNPDSFKKIDHLFQISLFISSGFPGNCFTLRILNSEW